MNVFRRKGVTYAAARRPACVLYPNRDEGVILRKTDERVNVQEYAGCKQHERIVWHDEGDEPYVRWYGKFRRIDRWYLYTDCWHIDHAYTALVDA